MSMSKFYVIFAVNFYSEEMNQIIEFLTSLEKNNNREWFQENKEMYLASLDDFSTICSQFLLRVALFDDQMKSVESKNSIFRIYRDIRFSKDKLPYKTNFGAFMAYPNGRKSERGGYYLHIEPKNSFIAVGVWRPQKENLKAIRDAIYYQHDEFKTLLEKDLFVQKFGTELFDRQKLKKIPQGYPKDFPYADWLKHKSFIALHKFDESRFDIPQLVEYLAETVKVGYPFLQFLNNAIDENA